MTLNSTPGYSGTPLARKLGFLAGGRVLLIDAPPGYADWLAPMPEGLVFAAQAGPELDAVHLFVSRREDLALQLGVLRPLLRPDAVLWVSWPKKASRVPSTVSEDTVRELALPLGWVDIKVCAVSEVWSGLKLVLRKALRPG